MRIVLAVCLVLIASAVVAKAQTSADTLHRTAGLAGDVRDNLGHIVKGARILVDGAKKYATTDDSGRFDLRGIAAGKNGFMVTKIGFAPVSFETTLLADSVIVLSIRMHAVQMLSTVAVTAARTNAFLKRVGYEERSRHEWGHFLNPEHVDSMAQRVMTATELLREVPGVIVTCTSMCHASPLTQGGCFMLWINGVLHGQDELEDYGYTPDAIAAIEVYTSPSTTPIEFQGVGRAKIDPLVARAHGGCGTLVIWTKDRVR